MLKHFFKKSFGQKTVSSFLKDESGVTIPLLAASALAVIGFTGIAVDIGRLQVVQSKLSFALDAAGLAAGATMSTTDATSEVTKYLNANFPTGFLGATTPTVMVSVSADNLVLTLTAQTKMDPVFMQIFGQKTQTLSAKSQITRTSAGIELALVLDNTGSMAQSSKLTALKTAATTLVNILYGTKTTVDNLWIGLVPFSQAVNIGTNHPTWMDTTYDATLNWGPTSWAGCVDARLNGLDVTDDPPVSSSTYFRQYYWPADSNNRWYTVNYYGQITYKSPLNTTSLGPNLYCPQKLLALTQNKTTILNAVNSMAAVGNTHINLGVVWGWRMLSPRWKASWALTDQYKGDQLPLNYGTAHMNKAVVILTDGENTMSTNDRTAYWYPSDNRLGSTNTSQEVTALNNRTLTVCNALKAKGVYVYTIALGSGFSTTSLALLKSCATSDSYYFVSPSSTDLQKVFSAIADSLSNLRVSQ